MFHKLGPERTHRDDRRLAAYLAFIAGVVNSAGFVVLGSFTSHVTGNVGRLADQVAIGNSPIAALAAATVTTFFLGALGASLLIESTAPGRMSRASAALLFTEALLIGSFVASATMRDYGGHRVDEMQAMLLSLAMGVQNSLVTRLSGAVVRTTHLTGIVTDLGIEAARWIRHWRSEENHTPRPLIPKVTLLLTIFVFFVVGSASGALLAVRYASLSLLPVVLLLVGGGIYALSSGRSVVTTESNGDDE